MTPPSLKEALPGPRLAKPKGAQPDVYSDPPPLTSSPPTSDEQHLRKRTRLDFMLPSDGIADLSGMANLSSPRKKLKTVLTTVRNTVVDVGTILSCAIQESATVPQEVESINALHMLQLARASRDTFAAHLRYHRLRIKELDIMRVIATNRCDQAETFLKKADWQIGEIKHILDREGIGLLEEHISLFGPSGREPAGSDHDAHLTSDISASSSCSDD